METQANKEAMETATANLWTAINAGAKGAALTPYKLAVLAAERKAGLRS